MACLFATIHVYLLQPASVTVVLLKPEDELPLRAYFAKTCYERLRWVLARFSI